MEQLRDFADGRLLDGCVYCDEGGEETRDHVPSRILLDPPFPDNLPVVPACLACNNSFSSDEQYFAALIECALAGSTDPELIRRPQVAHMLRRSPALRSRIESAKTMVDGDSYFVPEEERFTAVILKLARGHAAFELSQPLRRQPISLKCFVIPMMTKEQFEPFDSAHVTSLAGEVGSRGMQRSLVIQLELQSEAGDALALPLLVTDWVEVQEGRYRYLAIHEAEEINIKIVIAEYLACEVIWAT